MQLILLVDRTEEDKKKEITSKESLRIISAFLSVNKEINKAWLLPFVVFNSGNHLGITVNLRNKFGAVCDFENFVNVNINKSVIQFVRKIRKAITKRNYQIVFVIAKPEMMTEIFKKMDLCISEEEGCNKFNELTDNILYVDKNRVVCSLVKKTRFFQEEIHRKEPVGELIC